MCSFPVPHHAVFDPQLKHSTFSIIYVLVSYIYILCLFPARAVFDPSLAPPGKAVVHAYYAANEPYDVWKGLSPDSAEYKALKEERAQPLWRVSVLCSLSI